MFFLFIYYMWFYSNITVCCVASLLMCSVLHSINISMPYMCNVSANFLCSLYVHSSRDVTVHDICNVRAVLGLQVVVQLQLEGCKLSVSLTSLCVNEK